ncbi:glycerophosphodiester phosphodiesterase [Shewanella sp. C32]|uniref:Glycerophosphodiester phosphodiesterase n=1 Tax=Shewanella electrica TaxID=515560 RepID=A0ABT2FPG7_9GAMM|nr:glycerophosphodiester phosphodiesterase family protein [Shewanella electrica]MCH1926615.1 glycerophosphodiester phosphodiesterase [Shewanella electrica]MCS4558236.1 glycerophosphodiester phosphodiesterase [Shewanella electrica]
MHYKQLKPTTFFVIFTASLLFGCQSTPATKPTPTIDLEATALTQAFYARGFQRTALGNINYIGIDQCGAMTLQAHRGSIRYNENSINAVIDALDNQFPIIEIDVRLTRDDVWVIHHDDYTGRANGTVDNQRRRISSINYKKEWGYLRERDLNTGELTNTVPPTFVQLAQAFRAGAHRGQQLNIEIKGSAGAQDIEMLDYLALKTLGEGNYFYSSLELGSLEKMRKINGDVRLYFIQRPALASLQKLSNDVKRGAGNDPVYERNQGELSDYEDFGTRHYRERRYDNRKGLDKLSRSLKRNFGIVIDIRQYAASAGNIKQLAHARGIPVASYTVNTQAYHASLLAKLPSSQRPDYAIIDDTQYGFCRQYQLPPMQPYVGTTELTKQIAQLPQDLDLQRLDELSTYFPQHLYPAIDGSLKSFGQPQKGPVNIPGQTEYVPVFLDTHAGPRERASDVDLTPAEAIQIELRGQQQPQPNSNNQ